MSYTKKVGSQRTMKSIEDWYGLNKTTPDKWFERWEEFIVYLMAEIGYHIQSQEPITKYRGNNWIKNLIFTHHHLEKTTITFSRQRREKGGQINFLYGLAYETSIPTVSPKSGCSYPVMSRQKVGDFILHHVREGWSKSRDVNKES